MACPRCPRTTCPTCMVLKRTARGTPASVDAGLPRYAFAACPLSPKCPEPCPAWWTRFQLPAFPWFPHVIQPKPEITAGGSGLCSTQDQAARLTWPWLPRRKIHSSLAGGGPWVPCRRAGRASWMHCCLPKRSSRGDACLPKPRRSSSANSGPPLHQILQPPYPRADAHRREALHMRHLPQSLPRQDHLRDHRCSTTEEGCRGRAEESLSVCF